MNILTKFQEYEDQIQSLQKQIEAVKDERLAWAKENSKYIKSQFPQKGKLYKVSNPAIDYRFQEIVGEIVFFKPTHLGFYPSRDFRHGDWPTVVGIFLDCNMKPIETYDKRIHINEIEDISEDDLPAKHENKPTQVYVMIDKATGYYKIGRSVNPTYRERTLQSEKPTIELIMKYQGRIKDESEIHGLFKDKRVRGEWFDLSGSDLQKIRGYFEVK